MKILFLANRLPYPPYRGDKLKIYNLAKRLCVQHELHLIAFAQSADDWHYEEELKTIFTSVQLIDLPKWKSALQCAQGIFTHKPFQVHYFASNAMQKAVNAAIGQQHFDVVHVQHLRMAQYMAHHDNLLRILDLPDAFSLYWKRKQANAKNPLKRYWEGMEQKRVYQYERIIASYNLSLVCSDEDKQYLEQEHHLNNIALLPNGVDTSLFQAHQHDYTHNHTLLFTGNMNYGPNVDAVIYFAESIFPIVQKQFPSIQFIIAGQSPISKVTALASDKIRVIGFVPNLAEQYNAASVVVAPLRFGAGTQNKVLEAMAMGVPVVCSHIGFKGLGIESGEGAIMQTNPEAFAQSIIQLLSSAEMCAKVGQKGVEIIQSKFSWDIIAQQLEGYFYSLKK
ncbi:MAG: glycosyltransferase [Phycisphaerales bacterium]|nr:glycosyltransferase [Phycisphaerales bacterium]